MIAGLIQAKRNYNPSLVLTGEGFLLAYRSEPEDFTRSELVLATLDADLQVLRNQRLKVPGIDPAHSLEDPRLFMYGDCPYIAFSIAHYGQEHGWHAVQAYGRLVKRGKSWTLPKIYQPRYGANDWSSKEKNWTFFEAEGALRCIYDMGAAGWTVLELDGDEVVEEWRHAPLGWRYGRLSGGTPAVPWDGQLLTAFHSWERHGAHHRVYHAGFLSFEAEAPHAPTAISARPFLTAQQCWGFPEGVRWAPMCVFPGGLVIEGNDALISYGRNDLSCALGRFRIDGLVRVKPRDVSRERRVRLTSGVMVAGRPAYAGTEVTLPRFDADSLIALGRAVAL